MLLVVMTALFGVSMAASAADTKTADFNGGLPEGWSLVGDAQCADDRARTGKGVFSWSKSDTDNYLVTESVEGTVEFYARAYNKNSASQVIVYEYTASGLGEQLYATGSLRSSSIPSWSMFSFTLTKTTQLAIALNYAAIDDVTYTPAGSGGGGGTPDPQPDPAPLMGVSTTTVNFGRVTADTSETVTVSNTGNAVLEAAITVDNNEFTVSPANLSVAAGQSGTFTISYSYNAEAYGDHTATVTVTPNAGDAATIDVSAYVRNPNVWSEDFDAGQLPEDWINNGWSIGTSTAFAENTTPMALAPQSNTAGTLTTPRLLAKSGDVLSWDAYLRWNDETLLVEYTDDDEATWHTIYNYKAEDEQQGDKYVKAMSFTAPADGTYRLRFTSKFQNGIDNFYGFAPAPSTAVKETWHISYTFHYNGTNGEQSEEDTEDIEVEFDGNKVGFNFPNPFTGNAWMYGTRYEQDNIVYYIFPMGQYVGQYQGENIYYCGGANNTLADMQFFYNDDDKAFFNFEYVLLNSSTTSISLWAYFSDVVIYKNEKPIIEPSGIESFIPAPSPKGEGSLYNLRGQKVDGSYKGIVIRNGKKYLRK